MQKISHHRMVIYLLLLGLAPIIFVSMQFVAKIGEQEHLERSCDEAILQAKQKMAKEARNKEVRALYSNTDHYYIDKEIETLPLLQQETQELTKLLQHGFPQEEERLRKRLQFLKEQNKIVCTEGSVKTYTSFKETIESFSHSVEVDSSDIKNILQKVEGTSLEGSPHLIITDFKLERKKGTSQEVYSLDMKMLSREYTK